ncbi:MAG: poly-gamma-glutamate biosynthesis protein PgsC [Candidatus Aminicenantes bacterium]|nr:poly-gamma-glutamate biosynthesis protein PgsC [Candidatus Aminicenantes bacterium]MCJ7485562.1 poly-gamma-glutamate biosynthesis protein PgsC [Candidatus Aminicenantes bacterium]TFG58522.1 MAG: poly-gamma-glutamate biosynthesis protein PgsC [Candidatus Aminicenantes bacterium]
MIVETLLIGLVLALLWAEITDISPGGIIVPGYFALYLDRPLRAAATLAVALLTLAIYRFLARHLILFGRRRFVLMILVGAVLSQAWLLALPRLFDAPLELRVIGWVIPGILASSLARQKVLPTLASLAAVATMTFAVVRLVALL